MMNRGRPVGLLIGLVSVGWLLGPVAVMADVTHSVTVSATISGTIPPVTPEPVVQFSGLAAPSATVRFERDGSQISSQVAGSNASFSVTLSGQPTGEHTYVVSATDSASLPLASLTFVLTLASGSTTVVSGVFLGPTIVADKSEYQYGEPAVMSGRTAPSSMVTLSVSSVSIKSFTVQADIQGRWTRSVATQDLGEGQHTAKAQSVLNSVISAYSATVSFTVGAFDPAFGKKRSDINTDGDVNLIDFSILLFYWLQTHPKNARADIDKSGRVDIVDFSILLFEWTG